MTSKIVENVDCTTYNWLIKAYFSTYCCGTRRSINKCEFSEAASFSNCCYQFSIHKYLKKDLNELASMLFLDGSLNFDDENFPMNILAIEKDFISCFIKRMRFWQILIIFELLSISIFSGGWWENKTFLFLFIIILMMRVDDSSTMNDKKLCLYKISSCLCQKKQLEQLNHPTSSSSLTLETIYYGRRKWTQNKKRSPELLIKTSNKFQHLPRPLLDQWHRNCHPRRLAVWWIRRVDNLLETLHQIYLNVHSHLNVRKARFFLWLLRVLPLFYSLLVQPGDFNWKENIQDMRFIVD